MRQFFTFAEDPSQPDIRVSVNLEFVSRISFECKVAKIHYVEGVTTDVLHVKGDSDINRLRAVVT
jgi:hypothetical protein